MICITNEEPSVSVNIYIYFFYRHLSPYVRKTLLASVVLPTFQTLDQITFLNASFPVLHRSSDIYYDFEYYLSIMTTQKLKWPTKFVETLQSLSNEYFNTNAFETVLLVQYINGYTNF